MHLSSLSLWSTSHPRPSIEPLMLSFCPLFTSQCPLKLQKMGTKCHGIGIWWRWLWARGEEQQGNGCCERQSFAAFHAQHFLFFRGFKPTWYFSQDKRSELSDSIWNLSNIQMRDPKHLYSMLKLSYAHQLSWSSVQITFGRFQKLFHFLIFKIFLWYSSHPCVFKAIQWRSCIVECNSYHIKKDSCTTLLISLTGSLNLTAPSMCVGVCVCVY